MGLVLIILFSGLYNLIDANRIFVFIDEYDISARRAVDEAITTKDVSVELIGIPEEPKEEHMQEVCKKELPDLVLDFTRNNISSETIKRYSAMFWIPTISTTFGDAIDIIEWKNLIPKKKKILIQIKRPTDLVPEIVRSIVLQEKYNSAAILFDNSFVMMHKLKSLLINLLCRHIILPYSVDTFKMVLKEEVFNFFVIGRKESILELLTVTCNMNLYSYKYSFYGITLENGNFSLKCENAKFIIASPVGFSDDILDNGLMHNFHQDVMKVGMTALRYLSKYPVKFSNCTLPENVTNMFQNYTTDLYHILQEVVSGNKFLFDYKFKHGGYNMPNLTMQLNGHSIYNNVTFTEEVATWTSLDQHNLNVNPAMKKYSSYVLYNIAVAVQEPFIFPNATAKYNYSGLCIDILEHISERLEFEFNLYSPGGEGYRGDLIKVIKHVEMGKADIGLGPIAKTEEKKYNVSFTIPYYEAVGNLIMMKVPEASKSFFKIIEVIHLEVWMCVTATFFLSSFVLWIYDRWSPYSYQNNQNELDDPEEERIFTFKESLWFCLTSITSFGGGVAPRMLSGRIVVATWWLFGFMIIVSYSANLSAFLTASHLETSIESLDHLYRQSKVKYGVINGSTTMKYFQTLAEAEKENLNMWLTVVMNNVPSKKESKLVLQYSTLDIPLEPMFTRMLKYMIGTKSLTYSLDEAIAKVKASTSSEKFAFIGDASDIRYAILTNCDLQSVGYEFNKKFYSIVLPYESKLKEAIDSILTDLLNERIMKNIMNKWWIDNPKIKHCQRNKYQAEGITLHNIVGVFVVIALGIVVALVITKIDNLVQNHTIKANTAIN